MTDLGRRAFGGLFWLFAVTAALIFIQAGTLDYWQAWLFLALYFALSVAITLYLMRYSRELLKRRMQAGPRAEMQKTQKIIMALASAGFAGLIVVSALDYRFHWSSPPASVAFAGDGVRHPMYAGGLLMLAGVPLALGSSMGLLAMVPLLPILLWRPFDEEKFLAKSLPGYSEYRNKVRYRLLPFIS